MARKITKKDIERYNELVNEIDELIKEKDALRLMMIDDTIKYGIPTEDNENKIDLQIGKHHVYVTHIKGKRFSQSKFREENKRLYEKYKIAYEEDRVSTSVPTK